MTIYRLTIELPNKGKIKGSTPFPPRRLHWDGPLPVRFIVKGEDNQVLADEIFQESDFK